MRYVVRYYDTPDARTRRKTVRTFLESLAHLKEIQHVWVENEPLFEKLGAENTLSDLYTNTDVLYLRSLPHPAIDRKQFQKIVDAVLGHYQLGDPVIVDRISLSLIPYLPFPI